MPVGEGWDFTVMIPDGWYLREIDWSKREQDIAAFVDEMIANDPDLAGQRADMIERFEVFSKDADDKMALIAAMLWDTSGEVPIAADIRIHESLREAPETIERELDLLQEMAGRSEPGDLGPREVQLVDLPAGRAVRLRVLAETEADAKGDTIALDVVQHWVPVPERAEMIVISSSTPNLVFADDIVKAFDAVAETLEFHDTD
ncbi:MAG TPA: hypothetical protein VG929_09935 [Actinomycetota bacterium]|nr:hypothetical protein [Actinomycetota bacterium]